MAKLSDYGQRQLDIYEQQFKDWLAKLSITTDPVYDLRWSDRTVETAARISVLRRVMDDKVSREQALRYANEQSMTAVRHPHRSTSPMSNFVHQEEAAAWAWLAYEEHNLLAPDLDVETEPKSES